jgi:6-phosphogluconolactonase (cycloisomerase 2 family)
VAVDRKAGFVYSANYGGGSFAAYKLDTGTGQIIETSDFSVFFGKGQSQF